MFAVYLILSILLGVLTVFSYLHLVIYKNLRNFPGPSLFSYVKNLFKPAPSAEEAFEQLIGLNRLYGSMVKIWVNPFKPKLVVTNLGCIEQLLSSHAHLDKSKFYDYFDSFAGLGLATIPVPIWKIHRKYMNSAFRTKILEKYTEIFAQFGQELVTELKKNANGVTFDIHKPINMNTLHIICATITQMKTRSELNSCERYFEARKNFYRMLIDRSSSILTQYDFVFKLTKTYEKREGFAKVLNDFSAKIAQDYKRQKKTPKSDEDKHVIDVIFEKFDMGSKEMIDHISTFIVAGHETVSVALSFTLYELAKHPEVQRKIVEESNLVLGKNGNVKFADLQNLKYLDCVIKEGLRMYATVPAFERKTTEDMEIDGVRIPKGTEIIICAYNVHMDEKNYPNPHLFDPDRFLPENEHKLKPFSFLAFSLGPRNCIGKQFAILEMRSLLTKLLRCYEVLPAETPTEMKFLSEFSLKSSVGAPVRLIPRNAELVQK